MTGNTQTPDIDIQALQRWLDGNVEGIGTISELSKFPGGQSNPTYRLQTSEGSFVLRRQPFGSLLPSAHAVDREFRLISALRPTGFPVARPICLCEDRDVIGAKFYIMDLVEGRIFWDGRLPDVTKEERRPLYHALISNLARLHNLDADELGLGGFGASGNYFERQVGRWTKQYRAAETEKIEEVERLIEWLPATLPSESGRSILHGDYRIDNLVYAHDSSEIKAVLDWELATLGDPLADFAYVAMNWVMEGNGRRSQLGGVDLAQEGIPDLAEITDLYCSLTGRSEVPDMNWYYAYSLFRLVGILQGIRKRFLDGNASSAQAEETANRVRPLAELAWKFAQNSGA